MAHDFDPGDSVAISTIALCGLTFLSFIAVLVHLKITYKTTFDKLQMFSVILFLFLVAMTLIEGIVGIIIIDRYEEPLIQLFECINISLFFLFVVSLLYRMRAL